jgi:hypothetical protein
VFLYDPVAGQYYKCVTTPTVFTYETGWWTSGWEVTPLTLNTDALGDLFLFKRTTGQWFWVLGEAGAAFQSPASGAWAQTWDFFPADFNGDHVSDLLLYDDVSGAYVVAVKTESDSVYSRRLEVMRHQPSLFARRRSQARGLES